MGAIRSSRVAVFLAIRSVVRGNYSIALLTAFMMTLIYVNLLFLPSLIQGAVDKVNAQIVDTATSNIVITPSSTSPIDDVANYLAKIRGTANVDKATAVYRIGTQVAYGDNSNSWTVEAIDPASYSDVFTTPKNILEGSYLNPDDTTKTFLGIGIAGAGQTNVRSYNASLQSVHTNTTVNITLTNNKVQAFTVSGIYQNKFPLSDQTAFITMNEAEQLIPASKDHATSIYVRTKPGADINSVISALTPLKGGVKFVTSDTLASAVKDQVDTFNIINNILKVISLLVAAITIFIITYVDLVNKRRQIGIERAIGIKSSAIVVSYVLKAWVYALAGIIVGWLLFLYTITPYVAQHPFQFPNGSVTLAHDPQEMRRDVVILLVVAMIAAVLPALQAVKLKILDAIWGK